jgi:GNAT superfamily N-acetyltransferase
MQVSLSEVRFDSPVVQMLLGEWDDEIRAANPSFSAAGGSVVEAIDFAAPRGVFVLAVAEGTPTGCGGLRRLTSTTGEVKRLFVCRAARGRGVGRALLDTLEERAPQLGFKRLRLDAGGGEPGVLALFRSANYQPIEDYNGNHYARYWFEKQLPPP